MIEIKGYVYGEPEFPVSIRVDSIENFMPEDYYISKNSKLMTDTGIRIRTKSGDTIVSRLTYDEFKKMINDFNSGNYKEPKSDIFYYPPADTVKELMAATGCTRELAQRALSSSCTVGEATIEFSIGAAANWMKQRNFI